MLNQIKAMIAYNSAPVADLLKALCDSDLKNLFFLEQCKMLFESGIPFQEAWIKSISQCSSKTCLNKSDLQYLKSYSNAFGGTDIEGQIANCDLFIYGFQQRKEDVHKKAENSLKLYTMLGLLLGLLAVIILL